MMSRRFRLIVLLIFGALLSPAAHGAEAGAGGESSQRDAGGSGKLSLAEGFADPPAPARPAAYWCWVNGNTNLAQLTRELEEMKAKGLSGAYIFDVGAQDPDGIVPAGPAFMGPESLRAVGHAVREATRLGLEIGLVTSSSWNAGGSWVTPKHASMGLYHSQTAVKGPTQFSGVLPFPSVPKKSPKGADGLPLYYKDVAVLAVPGSEKLKGKVIKDAGSVINLTGRLDARGRLSWNVPAGQWTIMRFVCTTTGQGLAVPSPNSRGLAIDHFSPEATRTHFQYLIDRLRTELGGFENTALKTMYLCSYELRGSTWTPRFLEEFKRRRGYDMTPYLPALLGATVQNQEITERFRYDYRKTLGDLLVDAFYRQAREISNKHGFLLCAEAGGPGPPLHQVPVDALKALGALDIPRGEFWNQHDVWVVKETACASHIYGKGIVDMEAFTSWRHWQDGPFELKPLADRAMCGGTNHFTFHTSAHNPPEAGRPGWVYHAGTHMGPNRVWWPKAGPFIDYLSRCCYLLQRGLFVADVCYYYGDQGFNFVPPKHVDPSLGYGHDYDVTNAEVILTRMGVRDGRIVLPDGMSYRLLVLPDREDVDWDVLQKLEQLVRAGATVAGRKPTRSSGLRDYPQRDRKVSDLANKLWGPCDGEAVRRHAYGKGEIIWGHSLREILRARGIGPDFSFSSRSKETELDCIHRRTASEEIYFVSNKRLRWEKVDCVFRVTGKSPELWMPDTGEIHRDLAYHALEGGTKVSLRLPPAGSLFVVFRSEGEGDARKADHRKGVRVDPDGATVVQEITGPWEVRFPEGWGAPASKVFPGLISWTEDHDDGVRYFSGIATYYKGFELPAGVLAADKQLLLDLGRVRVVADVRLNGKRLGILWKPPFQLDITGAARPGENRLVVEVANTWSNRLSGDANSPEGKRYCRTNIKKALTWKSPWKEHPLLESGLLGPVRLLVRGP